MAQYHCVQPVANPLIAFTCASISAVLPGVSASGGPHSPTMTVGGTRDGVILGTAAYMSPEQARGRVVDKRTDVWAFACVLYEMLTGRLVFSGETVSDTIAAILEREPDWAALPDSTPLAIRRLLRRCLEKEPKKRLRDIGDVRLELEDPQSDTRAGADARPGRPHRGLSLTWSAMVIVAAAAGGFALGRTARPGIASSDAPTFSRVVRLTASAAHEMALRSHQMANGSRTCPTLAGERTSGPSSSAVDSPST